MLHLKQKHFLVKGLPNITACGRNEGPQQSYEVENDMAREEKTVGHAGNMLEGNFTSGISQDDLYF